MKNGSKLKLEIKEELGEKGCEWGRDNTKEIKIVKGDVNNIGKKIDRIIYALVALCLMLLGNSEVAATLLKKLIGP